jgi:thiol-disulfide isomerase/thioredoxin
VSFVGRLGLAIARPRAALALAGERGEAGRSGSDLLRVITLVLIATQLRALFAAGWLGTAVSPVLGLRAAVSVLSDTLVVPLAFLLVSGAVIWGAAGPRRDLGRALDLASVAVLPHFFVDLVATVIVDAASAVVPGPGMVALSTVAYAWNALLVYLAIRLVRGAEAPAAAASVPAGWAVLAVAAAGLVVQVVWLGRHLDRVKPMEPGDLAPAFALPAIGPGGAPGEPFELRSVAGKVTVVDFWATWCGPCLKALPYLDQLQRAFPDIAVITINIDDAAEARSLYDERGYKVRLLAGDQATSDRYGVAAIPHTVVIDRDGVVRYVFRGGNHDLSAAIAPLLR